MSRASSLFDSPARRHERLEGASDLQDPADVAQWEFTPPSEEEAEPQKDKATIKKLTAQRDKARGGSRPPWLTTQIVEQYQQVTRKWCKTDGRDHTLNLTRELVRNRLRIQSFEVRWSVCAG